MKNKKIRQINKKKQTNTNVIRVFFYLFQNF